MKKFWYLTKVSLKKKIGTKWFLLTNIFLALVIVSLININSIIKFFGGDFSNSTTIYVTDEVGGATYFSSYINNEEIVVKNEVKDKDSLEDNEIIVVLKSEDANYLTSEIISNKKIDPVIYEEINGALNNTKSTLIMINEGIDPNILASMSTPVKINRIILNDESSMEENMNMIMSSVFPTLILPFFMLVVFLIQMIGSEICEEKTTRSMEIIISNVSPKTHLFSKVLAGISFVFIEGLSLVIYALIGLFINKLATGSSVTALIKSLVGDIDLSIILDKLPIIIVSSLILMILTFISYALLSGILASMTVNIEDFNQLQTPVMLVSVIGYYLAISASMFNGSILIRILSYVPFLSAYLCPTLYIIGDISIFDIIISIIIMLLFIFILLKYGLKVYKNGILNYSTEKVWNRFKKIMKN